MRRRTAFTLVELLVVTGTVTALVAALAPLLGRARDAANRVKCASNLHQIVLATSEYVAQWRAYPPNVSTMAWYDDERVGAFLKATRPPVLAGKPGGGPHVCPNDPAAFVSYGMNVWAGSAIDGFVVQAAAGTASPWTSSTGGSAQLILFAESYSGLAVGTAGWSAPATVGAAGTAAGPATPGQQLGAGGGIVFTAGRFKKVTSELCFMRHRPGNSNAGTLPQGRLNIAFADGHVQLMSDQDVVRRDGTATGNACWSPVDLRGY